MYLFRALIALMFLFNCNVAVGEIVVIVNSSNGTELSTEDIKRIYLGKIKSFNDGRKVNPLNTKVNSLTDDFNEKVLGRTSSQIKAYWSKLVFTGKGTPPQELNSENEVVDLVANDADAIGYVLAENVTPAVKVVATF